MFYTKTKLFYTKTKQHLQFLSPCCIPTKTITTTTKKQTTQKPPSKTTTTTKNTQTQTNEKQKQRNTLFTWQWISVTSICWIFSGYNNSFGCLRKKWFKYINTTINCIVKKYLITKKHGVKYRTGTKEIRRVKATFHIKQKSSTHTFMFVSFQYKNHFFRDS